MGEAGGGRFKAMWISASCKEEFLKKILELNTHRMDPGDVFAEVESPLPRTTHRSPLQLAGLCRIS